MGRIDVIQSVSQEFLGSCEVCGKVLHNYRGVSGHLRWNKDPAHVALRQRWSVWRQTYRRVLRCRKCGQSWEIFDKALKDQKRCPGCTSIHTEVGKKMYERLPTNHELRTERPRTLQWAVGDDLYQTVAQAIERGRGVQDIRCEQGLSYKVFKAICESILGVAGYRVWVRGRKVNTMHANVMQAGKAHELEKELASQLLASGVIEFDMNRWQTLSIDGGRVVREADLKIHLPDGRKVVVLCDGEAFHGPKFVFGSAQERIDNDIKTARAYYNIGYSVLRYSESEIRSGWALPHLLDALSRLSSVRKVYRTWYPCVEEVAG